MPVLLRFDRVRVRRKGSSEDEEISGAIDFNTFDSTVFELTDPATNTSKQVPGLAFHITEFQGAPSDKYLNVVSKRLITALRPYLESGAYEKLRFSVIKTAERPSSTFSVAPVPV